MHTKCLIKYSNNTLNDSIFVLFECLAIYLCIFTQSTNCENNWLAIQNLRIALKKAVSKSFSQSSQRVMTEGFLKPNAKTAFFKAILKL